MSKEVISLGNSFTVDQIDRSLNGARTRPLKIDGADGSVNLGVSTAAAPFGTTPSTTANVTFSATGALTKFNGETLAGQGLPYLENVTKDTASLAGATVLATYKTPVSGLYRVTVVITAVTNSDTVVANCTYTDAAAAYAITRALVASTVLTHDSATATTSASILVRASAATDLVVNLTSSNWATTVCSTVIERLA